MKIMNDNLKSFIDKMRCCDNNEIVLAYSEIMGQALKIQSKIISPVFYESIVNDAHNIEDTSEIKLNKICLSLYIQLLKIINSIMADRNITDYMDNVKKYLTDEYNFSDIGLDNAVLLDKMITRLVFI